MKLIMLVMALLLSSAVAAENMGSIRYFAEERGDVRAMSQLGFNYLAGRGVPQDYAAAVHWLRKAADQGDAHAQYNLGLSYLNGWGLLQDNVMAHKWFNLAAATGFEGAADGRDEATRRMSREQIAEAQRLARDWRIK